MTGSPTASLHETLRRLHREKDAVYRDAWKKRGEMISILANIARKVDRLEYVIDGAPAGRDEAALDTAIDLLVYCIKYQTYLADVDASVADTLFRTSGLAPPFSQGYAGFEHLLSSVNLPGHNICVQTPIDALGPVLSRFNELQACFIGINAARPPTARLLHLQSLSDAAARLLVALQR
ncbi:MAG: hypothetical protein ACRDTX_11245 [Pseudonocardiaceae bacterium]